MDVIIKYSGLPSLDQATPTEWHPLLNHTDENLYTIPDDCIMIGLTISPPKINIGGDDILIIFTFFHVIEDLLQDGWKFFPEYADGRLHFHGYNIVKSTSLISLNYLDAMCMRYQLNKNFSYMKFRLKDKPRNKWLSINYKSITQPEYKIKDITKWVKYCMKDQDIIKTHFKEYHYMDYERSTMLHFYLKFVRSFEIKY